MKQHSKLSQTLTKSTPNKKINAKQTQRTSPRKTQNKDRVYIDLSTPTPELKKDYSQSQVKGVHSNRESLSSRIKQKAKDIEIAPLDVSLSRKEKHCEFDRYTGPQEDNGDDIYEETQQPAGRMTIGSINKVVSTNKLESNVQSIQKGKNHINYQVFTPFESSPNQNLRQQDDEYSHEKHINPSIKRVDQNFNSEQQQINRTALFNQGSYQRSSHLNVPMNLETDPHFHSFSSKNRDSLILAEKKEQVANQKVINLRDDHSYHSSFHRPSIMQDELEELPPLSPNCRPSQMHPRDHRFSIKSIQFSLISSLLVIHERSSMLSRASNKLNKHQIKNYQPQKDINGTTLQCPQKCSRGMQMIFSCCDNSQAYPSGRGRGENSSNHSNTSAFGKVFVLNSNTLVPDNNLANTSFAQNQQIYQNTEDFTDEVDEYQNDSHSHRLSIVKRYNINKNLYSPGSRVGFQSSKRKVSDIDSFIIEEPKVIVQQESNKQQNKLDQFVTKVPQSSLVANNNCDNEDISVQGIQINLSSSMNNNIQKNDESQTSSSGIPSQDIHRLHFLQTIQALHFIKNGLTFPSDKEIAHLKVNLPEPNAPHKKKTIIFDMDETLIHCVDDIDAEDPQHVIQIQFPDEDEPVSAGINIRPYIYECLEEANKHFQVIVFTASHKAYADAILDFIDPEHKYIQYRLYRDNCVQTKEGYYVKDLRILQNRDLKDLVIVDNSVYSFSFQIDNGIPIIPYYQDKEDEEMLHLIYYLNCLYQVEDVREQNQEAFELQKLQLQSPQDILTNYYTNNNQQQLLSNEAEDGQIIMEENEETQEVNSDKDEDMEEEQQEDEGEACDDWQGDSSVILTAQNMLNNVSYGQSKQNKSDKKQNNQINPAKLLMRI